MFVLDTNTVSELRKGAAGNPGLVAWAAAQAPHLMFLSAITILELELGILLKERKDRAQGSALRKWFNTQVLGVFADRILAVDTAVARLCAGLHVPDPKSERDALIASTAMVHGMTVVTRNDGDFEGTGASVLNPWSRAAGRRR
jgi:predicted nucleic acid-binding protein